MEREEWLKSHGFLCGRWRLRMQMILLVASVRRPGMSTGPVGLSFRGCWSLVVWTGWVYREGLHSLSFPDYSSFQCSQIINWVLSVRSGDWSSIVDIHEAEIRKRELIIIYCCHLRIVVSRLSSLIVTQVIISHLSLSVEPLCPYLV